MHSMDYQQPPYFIGMPRNWCKSDMHMQMCMHVCCVAHRLI